MWLVLKKKAVLQNIANFFIKIMQRINAINVGLNKINTIAICQNPILIKIKIILFDIKNLLLYVSDN
jgi:hypothetical protein